ncbi:MAG: OmpA family protein [Lewinellaceae bacterium]|nr:OmpA family protein [Lewinellaceae bacterium]
MNTGISPAAIPDTLGLESDNSTAAAPSNPPASTASPAPTNAAPRPSTSLSETPGNLDRVQIEDLKDHVIIHFPYNSTRREDNDAIDDYLQQLALYLQQNGKSITITGHTDMIGDAKANQSIGQQRANQIKATLTAKGVPAQQIKTYSKGESKPVATNDTPRGRYLNRRVEIRFNP